MKHLQLILWGLGSFFLASVVGGVAGEENYFSDSDERAIYQAKNNFKCPLVFGSFPDPTDCAHYYVCVAGVAVRRKCGILQHFDVVRRRCLPMLVAICGNDKTSTAPPVTATTPTKPRDNFRCPKFMGTFPHPNDCSKYYKCVVFVASLKTCPENQLFDTTKSSCRPEKEVNCGNRHRPGLITTAIPTESIVTEVSDAKSTEEELIISTTEAVSTEITSTTEEASTEITTTTTEIISTTKLRPTGPPDHTCDEDDVDCIITDTGDVEDWFICPRPIGSYPHPSSDKLFIFCMNWIPSVKKCGLNLVFSKEQRKCIETTFFVKPLL